MSENGYTLQNTYNKLDALRKDLEKIAPNPATNRLIEIDKEYTPQELRDLLQKFGSYLSNLNAIEASVEAECHAVKEAMKTGLSVAMVSVEEKSTLKDREAYVLANNKAFRLTRTLQIDNESSLIIVQGWRKAYEAAYNTISRLITLTLGELNLETSRIP